MFIACKQLDYVGDFDSFIFDLELSLFNDFIENMLNEEHEPINIVCGGIVPYGTAVKRLDYEAFKEFRNEFLDDVIKNAEYSLQHFGKAYICQLELETFED